MRPILAGTDTEYGLLIEGRDAKTQVEDSQAFVESYTAACGFDFITGWDYRYENPRNDLRGFQLKNLAIDPNDAKFDQGKQYASSIELRADRILANGARLYNDHGHPEYATPESFSIFELARLDQQGELIMEKLSHTFNIPNSLYKNNTDYHGASYGTHESYSIPRSYSVEAIQNAVLPMLIVRQILTGAGKVGHESGDPTHYQLSQRADFFVETTNAETLWRRPIFNTRDEPHADPADWIRLHVISGDANMNPFCTALRIGLVKLAIHLLEADLAPTWKIKNPVQAFKSIARDFQFKFTIELEKSWTNAYEIFESYFAAAQHLQLNDEMEWVIHQSRTLLQSLNQDWNSFRKRVDWATKLHVLDQVRESENVDWNDPLLQSCDLEYSNINRDEGLFFALSQEVDTSLPPSIANSHPRSFARAIAIEKWGNHIQAVGWRGITFKTPQNPNQFVELYPDLAYPETLKEISDVETFIQVLQSLRPND